MIILSPYRGILGVKWRYGVTLKSGNAKTEIRVVPPPLTLTAPGFSDPYQAGGGEDYPPPIIANNSKTTYDMN